MASGLLEPITAALRQPLLLPVPALTPEADAGLHRAPPEGLDLLVVGVLFAAQHDDPQKQDRQHGANDANSGSVHRQSPFL